MRRDHSKKVFNMATLHLHDLPKAGTELVDSVVNVLLRDCLPRVNDSAPEVSNITDSLSSVHALRERVPDGIVNGVQVGTIGRPHFWLQVVRNFLFQVGGGWPCWTPFLNGLAAYVPTCAWNLACSPSFFRPRTGTDCTGARKVLQC